MSPAAAFAPVFRANAKYRLFSRKIHLNDIEVQNDSDRFFVSGSSPSQTTTTSKFVSVCDSSERNALSSKLALTKVGITTLIFLLGAYISFGGGMASGWPELGSLSIGISGASFARFRSSASRRGLSGPNFR